MKKILENIDNGLHWFFVRKKMVLILLVVYVFSYILQSLFFSSWNKISAEDSLNKTQLVAIFVEQGLYDDLGSDIERYATEYVQKKISNGKALVFPVNVNAEDGLKATDIVKILENIYFDGIKDKSSSLIGLVLFGDIPLPIVETNGFLYPSIYPYVDFEEQQFIFDGNKGFFSFNDNNKGQAELWHGYIAFDQIDDYYNFFDRLREYDADPRDYAKKQIWYDDFVAIKEYYNPDMSPYYVNSFLFAEDVGYQRYNNLMLDMLQGNHNDTMNEVLGGVNEIIENNDEQTDTAGRGDIFGDFNDALGDYADQIEAVMEEAESSTVELDDGTTVEVGLDALETNVVPTLLLRNSVKEFMQTYESLFGASYIGDVLKGNLKASSRWYEELDNGELVSAFDAHFEKIIQKDSFVLNDFDSNYAPLFKEFNDLLEESLDQQIQEEKYYMKIPMAVTYQLIENENKFRKLPTEDLGVKKKRCEPDQLSPNLYVNYYYGKSAEDIYSAEDFSIFKGTYRNYSYDDLDDLDYDDLEFPIALAENNVSIEQQSVGGTLGLYSQQTEANRGFNIDSMLQEEDLYEEGKIHKNYITECGKYFKILGIPLFCMWNDYVPDEEYDKNGDGEPDMEDREEFAIRNWGGASSRNLDQDALSQGVYSLLSYDYTNAWKPIFDIAGSQLVTSAEYSANSYLAMEAYSSLIRVANKYGYYPYPSYLDSVKQSGKVKKNYASVEYFSVYNRTSDQRNNSTTKSKRIYVEGDLGENHIFWDGQLMDGKCGDKGDRYSEQEIYNYRLIDSRVKNDSVTSGQIGGEDNVLFQVGSANYANYQKILGLLNQSQNKLTSLKNLLIANNGIKESMQSIVDGLDDSQTTLQDFSDMDIDLIEVASGVQISAWVSELAESVSSSKGSTLYTIAGSTNSLLLDFQKDIDTLDVGQLSIILGTFGNIDYFLTEWKTDFETRLSNLKTDYDQVKVLYSAQVEPLYSNIGILDDNVLDDLSDRRDDIHALIKSGTISQGCNSGKKYYNLCTTIDTIVASQFDNFNILIDDLNLESLNDVKTKISEYYTVDLVFNIFKMPPFDVSGEVLISFFDIMGNELADKRDVFFDDVNDALARVNNLVYVDAPEDVDSPGGMTFSTRDRPTDTPRYITFQGLAGQKVMLIYPNLYQVEVFEEDGGILTLKSMEEIESSIRNYLENIVVSYNQKLQSQLDGKTNYYNNSVVGGSPNTFDMLASVDNLSTPLRSYALIDEDIFIELLGSESISMLAELLHYQNLPRQERKTYDSVADSIDAVRSSFDVNSKISYVVSEYLKAENDQGPILSPTYSLDAYEVAYINSDGNDYINAGVLPAFVKEMQTYSSKYKEVQAEIQGGLNDDQSDLDQQMMLECDIPANGAVPIFEWFDAFLCWLKVTLEKPIEFEINYSNAQGPVFGNFLEQLQGSFGSYEEQVAAYKDDRGTYKDEWEELLPFIEPEDELPPDSVNVPNTVTVQENVEYLVIANALMEEQENEDLIQTLGPELAQNLQEVLSYTIVNVNIEDPRVDSFVGDFEVYSTRDFGDIELRIKSVGNDCLGVPGVTTNLCEDPYDELNFNPFLDKRTLPLSISNDHKAGKTILTFELCLLDQEDICAKKTFDVNTLPGPIANTNEGLILSIASQKIMIGATMPIFVNAYDAYNNNVGQSLLNYILDVDKGYLDFRSTQSTGFVFSKFDRTKFVYHAPNAVGEVKIALYPEEEDEDLPSIVGNIDVVDGELQVLYNDGIVNEEIKLELQLPNTLAGYKYTDEYNLKQINTNNFPKVRLLLQELGGENAGEGLDAWISVSSKYGLIHPGSIQSRQVTVQHNSLSLPIPQYSFVAGTTFWIQDGVLDVYLDPDFVLGEDELIVSIPGKSALRIPVEVLPADPSVVLIELEKDSVQVGATVDVNIEITDVRGNRIQDPVPIVMETVGPVMLSGTEKQEITISGGQYNFEIFTEEPGGQGYLLAYIDTGVIPLTGQGPGYANILVQNPVLPEEDLNVMYLNLFGTDWGNQWGYFSDYNRKINQIFADSPKLLATTTQLIDPNKLLKTELLISENGQIKDIAGFDIYFGLNQDKEYLYFIDGVGELSFDVDFALSLLEEQNEDESSSISSSESKNDSAKITYIPEALDSIITENEIRDGVIYINGEKIFDINKDNKYISENLYIKVSKQYLDEYSLRELSLGEKIIGNFVIQLPGDIFFDAGGKIYKDKFLIRDRNYIISKGFFGSSSNGAKAIAISNTSEVFPNNLLGYDSIESSADVKAYIGFRGDFKNITLFAGGESVGESTLPFGSHFLINFGDPLLERIDNSQEVLHTEFDGGLGEVLVSTPDKTILKTIDIDFNNDGLKDLVTAYTDGTIKIFKNYGGEDPFKSMQNLMVLAGGIKDIYPGDVDGNGYDDLMIHTTRGSVRAYINIDGVFDVDGYQVCLNTSVREGEITDSPSDFEDVSQIFFAYMDEEIGVETDDNSDRTLDIVVNDSRGDIKIFYGGSTNGRANYLSNLQYTCDEEWFVAQEEEGNTKLVKSFGLRLDSERIVQDGSLVHRDGLEKEELPEEDADQVADDILGEQVTVTDTGLSYEEIMALGPFGAMANFDTTGYFDDKTEAFMRLQMSPVEYSPLYETLDIFDVYYIALGYLIEDDPVSIYKQYEDLNGDILEEGDEVIVTTTIHALDDVRLTYIDKILGPRYLNRDEDGKIEDFAFENTGSLNSNVFYRRDLGDSADAGYQYMIDNLVLSADDEISFSYKLRYKASKLVSINVIDKKITEEESLGSDTLDKDNYNDITVKPADPCAKAMRVFVNALDAGEGYKIHDEYYVDIAKLMADYEAAMLDANSNAMSDFTDAIEGALGAGNASNPMGGIPGVNDILESPGVNDLLGDIVGELLNGGDMDFNSLLDIAGDKGDTISTKLDDLMKGTCEGFKLNGKKGCQGLPLPFNMDFLSPGEFNIFGCPITDFNGFPIIFAPGTLPNGIPGPPNFLGGIMKGVGDSFIIWPAGGSVSSMIRIYLTVTLTMQIGLSICLGPMAVGNNMPPLIKDIGGNCVVVTMPLPCGEDAPNDGDLSSDMDVPAWMLDARDAGVCNKIDAPNLYQEEIITHETIYDSPLELVSQSDLNNFASPAVPAGSYFAGMINSETVPRAWIDPAGDGGALIDIDLGIFTDKGEQIEIGPDIVNKIVGGMKNGLMSCVIQGWLDKQIKYIFNNLTKMTITITFPDVSDLFVGFDKLFMDNLKTLDSETDCTDTPTAYDCVLKAETDADKRAGYIREIQKAKDEAEKSDLFAKASRVVMNSKVTKNTLKNFSYQSSNPFEAVATMFNEVELVNISTKDVNIKVPMIYGEDLVKYINQMKLWLEINQKILKEWTRFFKSMMAFCLKKDESRGLPSMEDVKEDLEDGRDGAKENQVLFTRQNFLEGLLNNGAKISQNDAKMVEKRVLEVDEDLAMTVDADKIKRYNKLSPVLSTLYYLVDSDKSKLSETEVDILRQELANIIAYRGKLQSCIGLFAGDVNGGFSLQDFLDFESSASELIESIRTNITVLEEYKKFPLEIYEWMHVTDKYMSELSSILSAFVGTITRWMSNNAKRYASYVDAIVLMIGSIKTWQMLIDLSANWSSKCSTCTTDTYDSYSCKLGFLCPELPILPMPPFKIPNIFIDLSNIDLGIDILLPTFNFQPQSFVLPKLPNLPKPPTMEVDINFDAPLGVQAEFNFDILGKIKLDLGDYTLPSFPIFPSPPDLPEIPSFLPTVKLELPVLPPAPEIPELIPEIQIVIGIAEWIGKILCITKGKIGLVSENAIKSKVEQMTQRTYDVPFFDYFDQKVIENMIVQKTIKKFQDKLDGAVGEEEIAKFQKLLDIAKAGDAPLKGFDYKIESFVALHFNFDHVFAYIDSIAQKVNGFTSARQSFVQNKITSASNSGISLMNGFTKSGMLLLQSSIDSGMNLIKDQTSEWADKVKDWTKYDKIEYWTDDVKSKLEDREDYEMDCLNSLSDEKLKVLEKGTYEELNEMKKKCNDTSFYQEQMGLLSYDEQHDKLVDGLEYLRDYPDASIQKKEASSLLSFVTQNTHFEMNRDELLDISHTANALIEEKQAEIQELQKLIETDYAKFLESIAENQVVLVANNNKEHHFDMQLFNLDDNLLKELADQEHPELTYMNMQAGEVDGYLGALDSHSFMELGMTETEYEYNKSYLGDLKNKIAASKPLFSANNSLNNNISLNTTDLLAQGEGGCTSCGGGGGGASVDLSQYAKGIFVDGPEGSGNKLNVVLSEDFVTNIKNNYYEVDMNNDDNNDLLMWDANNVYIKYAQQESYYQGGPISSPYDDYYVYRIDSMTSLWEDVIDNDGYAKIKSQNSDDSLWVKLLDNDWEVKNFRLQGQSFEQLRFSRTNSAFAGDEVDGYVIKLNQRVDTFYDAEEEYFPGDDAINARNRSKDDEVKNKQYVLVLPNNVEDYTGLYVDFEDGTAGLIDDLMTGFIVQVKFYNPQKQKISVILTDMPRHRLYAKIGTLKSEIISEKKSAGLFNFDVFRDEPGYVLYSPWSNQVVAGRQIIGDVIGPVPEITLHRILTDEIISTGIQHEGYVSTHYELQAFWKDNVAMKDMRIEKDDQIILTGITTNKTGIIIVPDLFFTGKLDQNYLFAARDFNGNEEYQEVDLNIIVPNINIIDINQLSENTANIVAEIDHDLDEGAVIFEKNRYDYWQYLSGTQDSAAGGYDLDLGQTIVTGSVYDFGINLSIYNIMGDIVAEINPKNGEIFVYEEYKEIVELRLVFDSHVPRVEIFDTQYDLVLFWVTLPIESMLNLEMKQGDSLYKRVALDNDSFGDFMGGEAIVGSDGSVLMYIGPDGDTYIPSPYNNYLTGVYTYNDELKAVEYTIQDDLGITIFILTLKVSAFL